MNKARRKATSRIQDELEKIVESLEDLQSQAEALKDEEEEYLDAMPENLEGSDRHTKAEQSVDYYETADGSLTSAIESINEALGALTDAAG